MLLGTEAGRYLRFRGDRILFSQKRPRRLRTATFPLLRSFAPPASGIPSISAGKLHPGKRSHLALDNRSPSSEKEPRLTRPRTCRILHSEERSMSRVVKAIYENGVLRPLEPVDLPPQGEVTIVILDDDVPVEGIAKMALAGGSFDFLAEPAEDVYTLDDGEPV